MSRPNKIRVQLEAALGDAETAMGADISVQKLIQTRLTILNKIASRQHSAKIRKLKEQLATSEAENKRLTAEVTAGRAEIERLMQIAQTQRGKSHFDGLDAKFKQIEHEYYATPSTQATPETEERHV